MPSSARPRMTSSTSPTSSGSSAEVASSKSIMSGSIASARAMATRCCWPPESCAGVGPLLLAQPDALRACAAAVSAASTRVRLSTRRWAIVRLPRTVRWGNRLNCWNTMPMRRRMSSRSQSGSVMSSPSIRIVPAGGLLEPVHAAQQRGLARARRADHADDLAGVHHEVDALQHLVVAEGLAQAAHLDRRDHRGAPPRRSSQAASRVSGERDGQVEQRPPR